MQWDFWTLSPESAHQVTFLMTDRGTPRTWRNMNGYGSHTFMWVNAAGEKFWVKYHFKTDQGIENFTDAEAKQVAAEDADFHLRDLHAAIEAGEHPSWTLEMQVMPFEDAAGYRFNPFDLTKVWPHSDYPPIPIGRMTLDRNPEQLLRRDRAGCVRAGQHGPRRRPEPGQDVARAPVQLPGHPPPPDRGELPAAAGQPPEVAGPLVQPRRVRCATRTRLTRCTRRTPTAGLQPTRTARRSPPDGT